MRRWFTALSVVVVVLAIAATSALAAKPSSTFDAALVITNTGATSCTGTLTVSWNIAGRGGVIGVTWAPDASDTGDLTFTSGGAQYSPPKKSGSVSTDITLTAGTGEADVTIQGSTFKIPTVFSNSVTCTPTG
jgi:hypothetical protein